MNHVLVVDDDPFILRSTQNVLAYRGLQVTIASSGAMAIRLLETMTFDAALVDYEMPGIDGLKVLSRIREVQPGCVRALMTGRRDFPMIRDAVMKATRKGIEMSVQLAIKAALDPRGIMNPGAVLRG